MASVRIPEQKIILCGEYGKKLTCLCRNTYCTFNLFQVLESLLFFVALQQTHSQLPQTGQVLWA